MEGLGATDWENPLVGCNGHDAVGAPSIVPLPVGGIEILPFPSTSESRVKTQNRRIGWQRRSGSVLPLEDATLGLWSDGRGFEVGG